MNKSGQISVDSTDGSSCKGRAKQQEGGTPGSAWTTKLQRSKSFHFDQNINNPFQSIPGKPFADLNAAELVNDIDFDKINEVKYFDDSRYSCSTSSHQPWALTRSLASEQSRDITYTALVPLGVVHILRNQYFGIFYPPSPFRNQT